MFRKNVGRLLVFVAGGGALAILIFVVQPMIDETAPPKTRDGIVEGVMDSDSPEAVGSDDRAAGADGWMPVPSPLVGVRDDGKEVPVVFSATEAAAAPEESPVDESGLLQALSADDVSAAMAALEGREAGLVAPVEDAAEANPGVAEAFSAAALETEGPADPDWSEGTVIAAAETEALAAAKAVRITEGEKAGGEFRAVPEPDADVKEQLAVPLESAKAEAVTLPVEIVSANGTGMLRAVEARGQRRVEFDLPVLLDSWTQREVSHPSGRAAATEAAQAGNPGLSPRPVGAGAVVPGTLRGVMGYRLPLVSRQEVPDQIVSGVLIPAHTTFVILKAGSWDLVDVTPEELERLREAGAARETATTAKPVRKGWNPLRIFRKRAAPDHE